MRHSRYTAASSPFTRSPRLKPSRLPGSAQAAAIRLRLPLCARPVRIVWSSFSVSLSAAASVVRLRCRRRALGVIAVPKPEGAPPALSSPAALRSLAAIRRTRVLALADDDQADSLHRSRRCHSEQTAALPIQGADGQTTGDTLEPQTGGSMQQTPSRKRWDTARRTDGNAVRTHRSRSDTEQSARVDRDDCSTPALTIRRPSLELDRRHLLFSAASTASSLRT